MTSGAERPLPIGRRAPRVGPGRYVLSPGGAMRFRAGMSSLGLPDAGEPVTVLRA